MISVIVLNYYPERSSNVTRLIKDLDGGTVKPDRLIVWNNDPKTKVEPHLDYQVCINSSHNFNCVVRHSIGLLSGTKYCLFIDDDITVKPDTLESLLKYSKLFPDAILGAWGKNIGKDIDAPYTSGEDIKYVKVPTRVDIVVGRLQFFKRSKLVHAHQITTKLDMNINGMIQDDIVLSMGNIYLGCAENFVLPDIITELSEEGVGLHHKRKTHYKDRDKTINKIINWSDEVYA